MKQYWRWYAFFSFSGISWLSVTSDVRAQSTPPPGVELPPRTPQIIEQITPTPSEKTPDSLQETPPRSSPTPMLKVPEVSDPSNVEVPSIPFFVERIEVLGSTVLLEDIAALAKGYEGKEVSLNDLLLLRTQISQLYIDNGYTTSGAFIPNNQDLGDGVVQVQVVEGELERIEINGLKRLKKSYVRDRIIQAIQTPLNQPRLEQAIKLLQLDPLIDTIRAELTAGSSPGQNVLQVEVIQAEAFESRVSFDNYRAPSIGTLQGTVEVSHGNVLGFGDRFSGQYSVTGGLDLYDLSYTVPFNARNGTVGVRFSNSDSEVIAAAFEDLGIRSESQTLSVSVRQPVIQTPKRELALGISFEDRQSQTFLEDNRPFSFSLGPDQGQSKVRAVRFFQDWVDRADRRVLAARSQFSLGLDVLDATVNPTGPSAEFFAWLGQLQWVQQLSSRNLFIAQVSAQLTPDSLLPLEKFSIGGIDTVRGYAQNQLLADNGVVGSMELLLPITQNSDRVQLNPFVQAGTVWNNSEANPTPSTLSAH